MQNTILGVHFLLIEQRLQLDDISSHIESAGVSPSVRSCSLLILNTSINYSLNLIVTYQEVNYNVIFKLINHTKYSSPCRIEAKQLRKIGEATPQPVDGGFWIRNEQRSLARRQD